MKDVREKLTRPLVRKISAHAHPPPPYPCWHTRIPKNLKFIAPKIGHPHLKNLPLSARCPNWTNPPWLQTSFMDSP